MLVNLDFECVRTVLNIYDVVVIQFVASPIVHTLPVVYDDGQLYDLVQIGVDMLGGVVMPFVFAPVQRSAVQRLYRVGRFTNQVSYTFEALADVESLNRANAFKGGAQSVGVGVNVWATSRCACCC